MDMKINDVAAGLYGAFYASGQIISPTLGGALYDGVGYENTCNIMALIIAAYTILFFVFNVGFTIFKQERLIKEKMDRLKMDLETEVPEGEEEENIADAVLAIRDKIKKQKAGGLDMTMVPEEESINVTKTMIEQQLDRF